jgi:hypothetical protein
MYPKKNAGTARNMRKTPITPCRYAKPAPPVNVQTEKPDMKEAMPATHHSTRLPALHEVGADFHEAHEVGADSRHQQQVTDKHNVIYYVN